MTFTREDVLKAARKVVEDVGPDYIYPGPDEGEPCLYAVNGAPSCLVGHVIALLDPEEFKRLAAVEKDLGTEAANFLHHQDRYLPHYFWTDEAAEFMQVVQNHQDARKTWGTSLAIAEDEA